MPRPTLRLTLAILALTLAIPATAAGSDTTFCVHMGATANCGVAGQFDEQADLQKAFDDATTIPGTHHTIIIQNGTFTPRVGVSEFTYAGTARLTINGLSPTDTTLSNSAGATEVLSLNPGAGTTLSGLTIKPVGTAINGANLTNTAISNVPVVLPASSSATGMTLHDSSWIDSTLTAANPLTTSVGVVGASGANDLQRLTLTVQKGVDVTGGTLTARNLRITSTGFGIQASNPGTTANVEGGLLTMPSGTASANVGLLADTGATLNARSLTVIGAKQATVGVTVNATGTSHSAANVSDTIFNNFFKDVSRIADPTALADLSLDHDIVVLGTDSGVPGAPPSAATNTASDPLFVNVGNGDYRPKYNSPAIDSGTPCTGLCLTIPDMAGLARPINGTIDRGAFEYARRPPSVNAVASETQRFIGAVSSFTAQGTDPDNDPLTYAWVFDDGATATGAMVNHQFSSVGFHSATVTATDPTGQTATATATTQIIIPVPAPGGGGGFPPGGGGTPVTPLTLTGLKLSNAKFAVSSSKTATSAKAKTPKGTTIRFTLSKPATVKFAFEQELKGVKAGGKCVKKSKAHRRGTSCKLLELKGTIIRRNLAAGARSVAFSGRIGSKPLHRGSFRLTATATDSAGAHVAKHAEFKIA